MDADVVASSPGPCPVCGMALEPVVPEADDVRSEEERDFAQRLVGSAAATVVLMIVAMAHPFASAAREAVAELLLATPVVLWGGAPFFARAWQSLRVRRANMFTLVALGTGVAFAYSAGVTVQLALGAAGEVYFESAAAIVTLVLAGQLLEVRARRKMATAVRALLDLTPKTARRIARNAAGDETETDVPVRDLRAGDRVRVRPGERVPADGNVVTGASRCDESAMTGEATPAEKHVGDPVTGGTMNGDGPLEVLVTRVGEASELAHIVRRVREAQRTRLPVQALVDQASAVFVPVVLALALVTCAAWLALGAPLGEALVRAVAVLVVACPCALGLATPLAVTAGIGRGASFGLLVRDAEALDQLARVDTVIFDKTGTLTRGRPEVVAVRLGAAREDEGTGDSAGAEDALLALAAAVEVHSEHPLGAAIVRASRAASIERARDVRVVRGEGIVGTVDGVEIAIGNEALLVARGVDVAAIHAGEAALEEQRVGGASLVHVAREGRLLGSLAILDPVRPSARGAVASLARAGLDVLLVSGDHLGTARAVAAAVGIAEGNVHGAARPGDKDDLLLALRAKGHRVAMVGDGINDAPALARADAGIALGGGTDIAIATAGLTLLGDDLRGVVRARRLGILTRRTLRQNLGLACIYNLVALPLAAGALGRGLALSPMVAAAAMTASSLSVVANALRLRFRTLEIR